MLNTEIRLAAALAAICLAASPSAAAQPERVLRTEVVVEASPEQLWEAFTTKAGAESWMVPLMEIDLRMGGTMRTNYDKKAGIGGPGTITHHILAYEPNWMLAMRFDAPPNAGWAKIAEACWTVIRFEPVSAARTRVVETMVGWGEGPEWDRSYRHFKAGNAWTLEQLRKKFDKGASPAAESAAEGTAKEPANDISKEVVINAPPNEVFKAWTTEEGLKSFLKVEGPVELRPGGAYEIDFSGSEAPKDAKDQPKRPRRQIGRQILSYVRGEMLIFSWYAPESFPDERAQPTWLVLTFKEEGAGKTRLRLVHHGFGTSGKWPDVKAYCDGAWTKALQALADRRP